jgi:50S ribosomal subunit-associated GTPase HflX
MTLSALNPGDVIQLRDLILKHFREKLPLWEVMIPYGESKLEAQLHAHGSIEITRHMEKGTFYRLRIEDTWAHKLLLDKYRL